MKILPIKRVERSKAMFPRKWLPDTEEKEKAAQFVMTATHVR